MIWLAILVGVLALGVLSAQLRIDRILQQLERGEALPCTCSDWRTPGGDVRRSPGPGAERCLVHVDRQAVHEWWPRELLRAKRRERVRPFVG